MTPSVHVSCPLEILPCAAASADSRLSIQAANSKFVERWRALGADPGLLPGGSVDLLLQPKERLRLDREIRQRERSSQVFSLTLTSSPTVLEFIPLVPDSGAEWLVTMKNADRVRTGSATDSASPLS